MVLFSGTTFCGNSPVDPSLLSLVHNEVAQLSLNLDDFLCQYKEQKEQLESQFLEVKRSLDQLLVLPQEFEQMKLAVETLEQQHKFQKESLEQIKQHVADLSSNSVKSEERAKLPTFFGALNRNEYFTGRVKELEFLERVFADINSAPDVRGVAGRKGNVLGICGLGGCGKSSLAFEYAWRNLEYYPGGVFVVNGESDDLMRASLLKIHGEFVGTAQSNQQQEAKPFEQLLTETLSSLGNLRDKWLLLVDNMDQKELSPSARTVLLGQWKSKASGDILVTSRRSSQALTEDLDLPTKNCFELDPFSLDESVEFLKKRIKIPSSCDAQDQDERELAQELGRLPLALEQAAAYIKALKCSIQLYLEQYRSQKCTLLNARSAKPRTEIYSEERLAVQTTWLLNFNYVADDEKDEGLGKAAAFFMKIAAYLPPDEIPIDILNVGAPEVENEDFKKRLEMPIGAKQIVDLLVRFSLFKRTSGDTLSIHRLVQETLRDRCDCEGETEEVLSAAIRMMHQAFLNCVGGTDILCEIYDKVIHSICRGSGAKRRCGLPGSLPCKGAFLEARRWEKLSVSALFLVLHLQKNSSLKPRFFCEETARLFCEAAFFCYSVGMERLGYRLQQLVFEILCAIEEPIRYYKDNDLMKFIRILSTSEYKFLTGMKEDEWTIPKEMASDGTGLPVDITQTDGLLEAIKVIAPKAREAFSRRNFEESADFYTDIVKVSNFNFSYGPKKLNLGQPQLVLLGEILCHRGIAHLKMEDFDKALDDFDASTCLDNELYRGYYWKAYTLCKLVESGRSGFISSAQAATAVLNFKFAHSKADDIQKLQKKFPGLLDRIEYKFVTQVSQLKELERQSGFRDDSSDYSLTVILAEGHYNLKKVTLLGGQYYFVCPPGGSASISCVNGLNLSRGSFLFENVKFANPDTPFSLSDVICTERGVLCFATVSDKGAEELCTMEKAETLTLGRPARFETELNAGTERNLRALIEANDVHSLVIDHCVITSGSLSGIVAKSTEFSHSQRSVLVRSSVIMCSVGNGIYLQGDAPFYHISVHGNRIENNLYGLVIDSPSRFCLEKNDISYNMISGFVAMRAFEGILLRNTLNCNRRNAIVLNKANAFLEENDISSNLAWGIVCCRGSNLRCKKNTINNNRCGGLRIMLNGKANVLVQECEFRENLGPAVFPTAANEFCQTDLKWKQFCTSPRKFPISLHLMEFLKTTEQDFESIFEFNSPSLLDNRVSDAGSDVLLYMGLNFCSSCHKDMQMHSNVIECPRCHVAGYCSTQCSDRVKTVHNLVCKSILEAHKESEECGEFRKLSNEPPNVQDGAGHNREDLSLCVITAIPLSVAPTNSFKLCLLACPQQNLWTFFNSISIHEFLSKHGRNLPEFMLDNKAACILANVDSESKTITVHNHRLFPLEKVPNAFKWVEKLLHAFAQHRQFLASKPRDVLVILKK